MWRTRAGAPAVSSTTPCRGVPGIRNSTTRFFCAPSIATVIGSPLMPSACNKAKSLASSLSKSAAVKTVLSEILATIHRSPWATRPNEVSNVLSPTRVAKPLCALSPPSVTSSRNTLCADAANGDNATHNAINCAADITPPCFLMVVNWVSSIGYINKFNRFKRLRFLDRFRPRRCPCSFRYRRAAIGGSAVVGSSSFSPTTAITITVALS